MSPLFRLTMPKLVLLSIVMILLAPSPSLSLPFLLPTFHEASPGEGRSQATKQGHSPSSSHHRALLQAGSGRENTTSPDPRRTELQQFEYMGGSIRTGAFGVALLFLGDGWGDCAPAVLQDVFRGLDTRYLQDLPERLTSTNFFGGNTVCLPTPKGWWSTVAAYNAGSKTSPNVTSQIKFFGSYSRSAAQMARLGSMSAILESVGREMVDMAPQRYFAPLSAKDKKGTLLLILLGRGLPARLSFFSRPSLTARCAVGYFTGPGADQGVLKGYFGAVVAWGPHAANYSMACSPYPADLQGLNFSNNCPKADVLTSHLLAQMADLATNPSQFLYNANHRFYNAFVRQTLHNTPAWTCREAAPGGKYTPGGVSCSAGDVCDLRLMPTYRVSSQSAGTFAFNAPPGSPEAIALRSAGLLRDAAQRASILFNLASGSYLHFVQPYRNSAGQCFSPRWTSGACPTQGKNAAERLAGPT